ncbi:uncharacterized protein LAESUDRAFT_746921 [Laetiporus sulphureus 93-53]|uniref:Uncharacterized protein n=1 Tax=Laetiporus sulphureus 93-53 TaxID=1314785 RepID=A0A165HWY1_9APHY|nr:uncharacterized protein LAESUDRAFT_746921 [Laetiporus sulphureus 93-53]KZT12297.1 hypothetical protein LAESUDRAFT_746921 [Laetiporus sulphureus 93-53]
MSLLQDGCLGSTHATSALGDQVRKWKWLAVGLWEGASELGNAVCSEVVVKLQAACLRKRSSRPAWPSFPATPNGDTSGHPGLDLCATHRQPHDRWSLREAWDTYSIWILHTYPPCIRQRSTARILPTLPAAGWRLTVGHDWDDSRAERVDEQNARCNVAVRVEKAMKRQKTTCIAGHEVRIETRHTNNEHARNLAAARMKSLAEANGPEPGLHCPPSFTWSLWQIIHLLTLVGARHDLEHWYGTRPEDDQVAFHT